MNFDLHNPQRGDRLSAAKMAALMREVRSNRLLQSPGVRVSRTPHGTHIEVEVQRALPASVADNGCWKIVPSTREEEGEEEGETVTTPVHVFANQFYLYGEVMHELELEDAVEDFVCQGEPSSGEEYSSADKPFVALKVPATTNSTEEPMLDGYKTLAELQAAQNDPAYVVKPLYKFTHDGGIKIDLRNCPQLQVAEIMP